MSKLFKIIGAVAIINIAARLFGFGREVVIGIQYGTSTVADAIATAYTIPNFIYLVLGGDVFIGRHVIERLKARGDKVFVYDTTQRHDDVPYFAGDIRDKVKLSAAMREVRTTTKLSRT